MSEVAVAEVEINKSQKSDLLKLDPRIIEIDHESNPRVDYGDIEALKRSILERGVRVPIKVQKVKGEDRYILIHGFRRMTAVMALIKDGHDIPRISAIPMPLNYSAEDILFDHFTENDGQRLNPLEEAELFKRLNDLGYKQAEIAHKIGRTASHVSQMMKLANASKFVKDTITEGKIACTLVLKVLNTYKDDPAQAEAHIRSALARLEGTGAQKVTEKTITVIRKSKYQKRFESALETLRERETPKAKLEKIKAIVALFEEEDTATLAEKLLAII